VKLSRGAQRFEAIDPIAASETAGSKMNDVLQGQIIERPCYGFGTPLCSP